MLTMEPPYIFKITFGILIFILKLLLIYELKNKFEVESF
jgi:hypothetical protein